MKKRPRISDPSPNNPPQSPLGKGGSDPPQEEPGIETVTLALALGEIPPTVYISRHLDIQLDTVQSVALRRLFEGCIQQNVRLANGRYVQTMPDVVRYILDQIGEEVVKKRMEDEEENV